MQWWLPLFLGSPQANVSSIDPAGIPYEPPEPERTRAGGIFTEGPPRSLAAPGESLRLVMGAEDAPPAERKEEGVPRERIDVLLGGCGDGRALLATLLDAAHRSRDRDECEDLLVITLNDHTAEVVARAFMLAYLLKHAEVSSDLLPSLTGEGRDRWDGAFVVDEEWRIALAWHVYLSPTLCTPMHKALRGMLRELADMPLPPFDLFKATDGSWEKLRSVFRGWAGNDMSVGQERKFIMQSRAQTRGSNSHPDMLAHGFGAAAPAEVRLLFV